MCRTMQSLAVPFLLSSFYHTIEYPSRIRLVSTKRSDPKNNPKFILRSISFLVYYSIVPRSCIVATVESNHGFESENKRSEVKARAARSMAVMASSFVLSKLKSLCWTTTRSVRGETHTSWPPIPFAQNMVG